MLNVYKQTTEKSEYLIWKGLLRSEYTGLILEEISFHYNFIVKQQIIFLIV